MRTSDLNKMFNRMIENWPSEWVARKSVEQFTGGLMTGKTIANIEADKEQESPPKLKIGRLAVYPKVQFVEWLKARVTDAQGNHFF